MTGNAYGGSDVASVVQTDHLKLPQNFTSPLSSVGSSLMGSPCSNTLETVT